MGVGIVVGNVINRSTSESIGEPNMWLRLLQSYTSGKQIGLRADNRDYLYNFHATGDSTGSFIFPFIWNHEDIADVIDTSSTVRLYMGASQDTGNDRSGMTYFSGWQWIPGFLFKDMAATGGITANTLTTAPGLLDFTKNLILAYEKVSVRPFYRQEMLSSEGFMILAAGNFYIDR